MPRYIQEYVGSFIWYFRLCRRTCLSLERLHRRFCVFRELGILGHSYARLFNASALYHPRFRTSVQGAWYQVVVRER